jgi:hypothetical protein
MRVVRMKPGHILPPEEGALGCRLQSDEDIEAVMVPRFQQQARNFFAEWNQGVLPPPPMEIILMVSFSVA